MSANDSIVWTDIGVTIYLSSCIFANICCTFLHSTQSLIIIIVIEVLWKKPWLGHKGSWQHIPVSVLSDTFYELLLMVTMAKVVPVSMIVWCASLDIAFCYYVFSVKNITEMVPWVSVLLSAMQYMNRCNDIVRYMVLALHEMILFIVMLLRFYITVFICKLFNYSYCLLFEKQFSLAYEL